MMKSKSNSERGLNTADEFYKLGEQEYKTRGEMLTTGIGIKVEIESYGGLAAGSFYQALALGHQKAPFALYACFGQGIGVDQDDNLAAMMFGVAKKLKDPRCKGLKVKIPKYMKSKVKEVTKLVQETHNKIPDEGVSTCTVLKQMEIFQSITLPDGRSLQDCFITKQSATHDVCAASTSAHDTSVDSVLHDTSFDELQDIAMGGMSPDHHH